MKKIKRSSLSIFIFILIIELIRSDELSSSEFDRSVRKYKARPFRFQDDPTIISVTSDPNGNKPLRGIPAGGIKIYVNGTNFKAIKKPQIYVNYDGKQFNSNCITIDDEHMKCDSPVIPAESNELNADDPTKLEFGFLMDGVLSVQNLSSKGFQKFELCPNPSFDEFENGRKTYLTGYISITGKNLDCAAKEEDVIVTIEDTKCYIISISRQELLCHPQIDGLYKNE